MAKVDHTHELNAGTWNQCDDLWLFHEFFLDKKNCAEPPSDRKFRLLVVAALRAVWKHLSDPRSRAAVEAAEEYADTQEPGILTGAQQGAEQVVVEINQEWDPSKGLARQIAWLAGYMLDPDWNNDPAMPSWAETVTDLENDDIPGRTCKQAADLHLHLFFDIFDNPFRPVAIDLNWVTPTVQSLAQAAYAERIAPDPSHPGWLVLDPKQLLVLTDALLDAGAPNDSEIIQHLRDPGPHVRGCLGVDSILGKG